MRFGGGAPAKVGAPTNFVEVLDQGFANFRVRHFLITGVQPRLASAMLGMRRPTDGVGLE
jgi:hypothetical protein